MQMKMGMNSIFTLFLGLILAAGSPACKSDSKKTKPKDSVIVKKEKNQDTLPIIKPAGAYHELAMHMAGMKVEGKKEYASLQQDEAWIDYSHTFDSLWKKLEKSRLSKQRNWAKTETHPISKQTKTLFYPFSGADYLNAGIFFPDPTQIVMIGLEPAGSPPSKELLQGEKGTKYFSSVRKALYSLMQWSFFQTKFMAKDFKSPDLNGTLPLIMIFLVRNHQIIEDIHPVTIGADGQLMEKTFESFQKPNYPGVAVRYHAEGSTVSQTLIYFSADISDPGIDKNQSFKKYLQKLNFQSVYLKSASYLMHAENFSWIRSLITGKAEHVLQDDSGIPYKYFPSAQWDRVLYGIYDRPIKLFAQRFQKDFLDAYQDKKNVKPLPFGIGYDWQENTSNLWFAHRKKGK